jgi:hypothetical protein
MKVHLPKCLTLGILLLLSNPVRSQSFTIQASSPVDVCNTCVSLSVLNPQAGYNYQWQIVSYTCSGQGTPALYAAGIQIQACSTGEFFCISTSPGGTQEISNSINVRALPGSAGSPFLPKPYNTTPVTCLSTVPLCIPTAFYSGFTTTIVWYKDNTVIPGANSPFYNATTSGYYKYSVTSPCITAFSDSVNVLIGPPLPVITSDATSPVCTQDTIEYSVANPQPGFFYIWERNTTGNTFVQMGTGDSVSHVVMQNTPALTVRVKSNGNGCLLTSNNYTLQVIINNPVITPNGSITICAGTSVLLTGTPGSTGSYTYQWYRNGNAIAGATSSTYNASQNGSYQIAITAACGTNISSAVTVSVVPLPTVTVTPDGPVTFCKRDSVILNSTATGSGITYQWRKFGNNIIGATNPSYTALASGKYTLRVTNSAGCFKTSSPVTVTVNPLPEVSITANGPIAFCAGDSVQLSANFVAGNTYQWKRNNNLIAGATGTSYTAKIAAKYRVIATSTFGCTRVSNTIEVFVPCRQGLTVSDSEKELSGFNVEVFPNPSSDRFNFEIITDEPGMAVINVYDITGKKAGAGITTDGHGKFEVDNLRNGIYAAEIILNGQRKVVRIIKTN